MAFKGLISIEIKSILKEINCAEHEYMNMSPSLIEMGTLLGQITAKPFYIQCRIKTIFVTLYSDDKVIGYICKEPYFSRMIVKYSVNSNQKEIIVEGSGSQVIVPANATRITVKFENMRFFKTWCDVKKYNRFTKCWIKPTVPHVFTFSTPVSCTFTLQGNLFYVAVMKVTGNDSELDIMD